jgi:hypothetical protein
MSRIAWSALAARSWSRCRFSCGTCWRRGVGVDAAVVCGGPAVVVAAPGRRRCRMGSGVAGRARDFCCWIQLTAKQRLQTSRPRAARMSSRTAGAPNPVTGKPTPEDGYASSTVAHSETVLRQFYDFHRDCGTGPVLNPFPLDASRRGRRPHAHYNPMETSGCRSGPGATGRRCPSGSRGRSPTSGSTSCSRRCHRTGTGRW